MPSRRWRGLYAVTPGTTDTQSLAARVRRCLEGGAAMVQYRAKALEPGLALVQARSLASLCREFGVPFIVNDSLPLALACDADGVHVGRDDAGVREARIAMPRAIVGASCYADPRLAARAAAEGADYVAIGSLFASSTKPAAPRAPLELLAAAAEASGGLPVVAIGGITPHNAPAAVAAGADLLAVISAVFDAPDVRAAAEAFTRLYATKSGDRDVRPQPRPL